MKFGLLLWALWFPATAQAASCTGLFAGERSSFDLHPSEMFYKLEGDAENPIVVLIHGLNETHRTWRRVVRRLQKNYRVLSYDLRGNGKTPPRGKNYSSTVLARDLNVLLEYLDIDGPVAVVGHSAGGRIAMRFAQLYPEKTGAMIIEDIHGMPENLKSVDNAVYEKLLELVRPYQSVEAAREALSPFFSTETDSILNHWLEPKGPRGDKGQFHLTFRPEVAYLLSRQVMSEDLEPAILSIQSPSLFVTGDSAEPSTVLKGGALLRLRAMRPDFNYLEVKGVGHNIHRKKGITFGDIVVEFLERGSI